MQFNRIHYLLCIILCLAGYSAIVGIITSVPLVNWLQIGMLSFISLLEFGRVVSLKWASVDVYYSFQFGAFFVTVFPIIVFRRWSILVGMVGLLIFSWASYNIAISGA